MLCLSGFELPATIEQKDNLLQQKTLSTQDSEDCFFNCTCYRFSYCFFVNSLFAFDVGERKQYFCTRK